MTRYVCIAPSAGSKLGVATTIKLNDDTPTHVAVEAWQRQHGRDGQPAPCTWQYHEGDAISALVALARIS